MSTSRGNAVRTRPQKHQNKTAYKNDMHDKTEKTKFLNSLAIFGVCKRCKDIIDWKIKYKKYKPLTAPRKCIGCEEKTIKYAYHILCGRCATERKVCAKCRTPVEASNANEPEEKNIQNVDLQSMLKSLPERKRRTILRLTKTDRSNKTQSEETKLTPEMILRVEEMVQKMDKSNLDDFASDGSDLSASDNED